MPAEGTPSADRWFSQWLGHFTRVLLRAPVMVVMAGAAVAVVCGIITARRLEYRTSRMDLLNPKLGCNQLWIEYIKEFGAEDDAVVVVEGSRQDVIVPVLTSLSRAIERHPELFRAVLHEIDLSAIRAKALHYLPPQELSRVTGILDRLEPVLRGHWSLLTPTNMIAAFSRELHEVSPAPRSAAAPGAEADLVRLVDALAVALTTRDYVSPWSEMPEGFATLSELGSQYLLADGGRVGFILLRLVSKEEKGFARGSRAIDRLRAILRTTAAAHPDVRIGLTGLPVMEYDEMRISQREMALAGALEFVGVLALFVAGYGRWRASMAAILTLGLGMAWSCGYLTLVVGHLNILSSAFAVVLIGVGINYPIHYIAHYLSLRRHRPASPELLVETSRACGRGILTGAVTTALAFFAAAFTEFTGVAELGLIAGGGILLCVLATLTILPPILLLVDRQWPQNEPVDLLRVDSWVRPALVAPGRVVAGMVGLTLVAVVGIRSLWYDHNLLNLQSVGLESVELEHRLLAEHNQSVWFALSIADSREELLRRKQRFLALGSVERTEEIVSLLPADSQAKLPIIAGIRERLAQLPERPPELAAENPEALGQVLAFAQGELDRRGLSRASRQVEQLRQSLRSMSADQCMARLGWFQQRMAAELLSRLHILRTVANPDPPRLEDLPASLVTRFVGKEGKHLLKIYARGNTWDMDQLQRFVREVRSVDPRATGNPLQTYEASLTMQRSYLLAALYSFLGISIAIQVDLRSWRLTALAMLPLLLGMLQTFGVMGLLGIPLNPANMIVLPLLIGMGVEDGVHLVHDYRAQRGRRYRPSPSVALAVVLTTSTTIASFASLMTASHRGLYSLGRIMTLGVSFCLVTSLILLPALMAWFTRKLPREDDEVDRGGSPIWHSQDDHAGTLAISSRFRRSPSERQKRRAS